MTVDIEESELRELQRITGETKKSPAVSKALAEYLREVRKRRLLSRVMEGRADYGSTNADLEREARYDTH